MSDQSGEEVPVHLLIREMEQQISQMATERVMDKTRLRVRDETITSLQEQNVTLQRRINEYEAESQNAVEPKKSGHTTLVR